MRGFTRRPGRGASSYWRPAGHTHTLRVRCNHTHGRTSNTDQTHRHRRVRNKRRPGLGAAPRCSHAVHMRRRLERSLASPPGRLFGQVVVTTRAYSLHSLLTFTIIAVPDVSGPTRRHRNPALPHSKFALRSNCHPTRGITMVHVHSCPTPQKYTALRFTMMKVRLWCENSGVPLTGPSGREQTCRSP